MRALRLLAIAAVPLALGGCDTLGVETPKQIAAKREAESRAIGGACRHAGRPIEECFSMNRRADKASMFAGWREMNDYMRENRMDTAPAPAVPPAAPAAAAAQLERDIPARSVKGESARNGV